MLPECDASFDPGFEREPPTGATTRENLQPCMISLNLENHWLSFST